MILDASAKEILERWQAARLDENAAIVRLHSAMAAGERNQDRLLKLTEDMERAHDQSMRIYQELQEARLDKK